MTRAALIGFIIGHQGRGEKRVATDLPVGREWRLCQTRRRRRGPAANTADKIRTATIPSVFIARITTVNHTKVLRVQATPIDASTVWTSMIPHKCMRRRPCLQHCSRLAATTNTRKQPMAANCLNDAFAGPYLSLSVVMGELAPTKRRGTYYSIVLTGPSLSRCSALLSLERSGYTRP